MHRKILSIILASLAMLLACLSWWSVGRAIQSANSFTWATAVSCFSLLFIVLSLSMVLIREILSVELLLIGVAAASFFFVFVFWQLAFVLLGLVFLFWGMKRVRRDMELNVKIDLWKSLQMGRSLLIIGFAIVITSQYYFTIQKADGPKIVPHFETGSLVGTLSTKIMAFVNPDFKALQQNGITVDEFILQTQQNQTGNVPGAYTDLVLQQGRAQLSQMTGENLNGSEKMSDVFSGFIDKKIDDYFSPSVENPNASKALPFIMSAILFFTIWPIGSFVSIFLILIAWLIFLVFVRLGFVTIRKIPVEMEVLE